MIKIFAIHGDWMEYGHKHIASHINDVAISNSCHSFTRALSNLMKY